MSLWLSIVTHPVYLLACMLICFAGRKRRTGMFGYFMLSFLLTPLIMLFVLVVGSEKPIPDELDDFAPAERPDEKKKSARSA